MKNIKLVVILFLFLSINTVYSQNKNAVVKSSEGKTDVVKEERPQFPGGDNELINFIIANFKYPADAQKNGIEGTVVSKFLIDKTGKVDSIEIIRSVHQSCDNEVIRLIKLLPKFTPGKLNNENVSVWFTLPVAFNLEYDDTNNSKQLATTNSTHKDLSSSISELNTILESLMPEMVFNANSEAELKQKVKEEDVIEHIRALINQGIRIDLLRIIDFESPTDKKNGGWANIISNGKYGKLVSVAEGKTGVSLIEYCEAVNYLKIAKLFNDEVTKVNYMQLNTDKRLIDLRLKAEKGDINSQLDLGDSFTQGVSPLEKDFIGAIKWYQMAADNGSSMGQYNLACIYWSNKLAIDQNKAFSLYLKCAEQGESKAFYIVATCYYFGNGTTKDLTEAVKWFTKTADAGDVNGLTSLAYLYYNGEGVAQDYKEAIKWYTKAAEQGNILAITSLGVMYYNGNGVPQDYMESEKWFTKGAELGDETCKTNLESVKKKIGK